MADWIRGQIIPTTQRFIHLTEMGEKVGVGCVSATLATRGVAAQMRRQAGAAAQRSRMA